LYTTNQVIPYPDHRHLRITASRINLNRIANKQEFALCIHCLLAATAMCHPSPHCSVQPKAAGLRWQLWWQWRRIAKQLHHQPGTTTSPNEEILCMPSASTKKTPLRTVSTMTMQTGMALMQNRPRRCRGRRTSRCGRGGKAGRRQGDPMACPSLTSASG
jgi:hypothetical protein